MHNNILVPVTSDAKNEANTEAAFAAARALANPTAEFTVMRHPSGQGWTDKRANFQRFRFFACAKLMTAGVCAIFQRAFGKRWIFNKSWR